jgi:serine/threonine protein phosphatase PrpC
MNEELLPLGYIGAFLSDIGRNKERTVNEDTGGIRLATPPGQLPTILAYVSDGMGGMAMGEVASAAAGAAFFEQDPAATDVGSPDDLADWTVGRVWEANTRVMQELHGARGGATFTGIALHRGRLTLAHVGDSRAYLFGNGQLVQISQDHSLVAALVKAGTITPEEALVSSDRNQILRSLGDKATLPVGYIEDLSASGLTGTNRWIELAEGQGVLLCSDGVWGEISQEVIHQIVTKHYGNPEAIVRTLIDTANNNGGPDNSTAVVIQRLVSQGSAAAVAPLQTITPKQKAPTVKTYVAQPSPRETATPDTTKIYAPAAAARADRSYDAIPTSASPSRTPLLVGIVALALAAIGGLVYLKPWSSSPKQALAAVPDTTEVTLTSDLTISPTSELPTDPPTTVLESVSSCEVPKFYQDKLSGDGGLTTTEPYLKVQEAYQKVQQAIQSSTKRNCPVNQYAFVVCDSGEPVRLDGEADTRCNPIDNQVTVAVEKTVEGEGDEVRLVLQGQRIDVKKDAYALKGAEITPLKCNSETAEGCDLKRIKIEWLLPVADKPKFVLEFSYTQPTITTSLTGQTVPPATERSAPDSTAPKDTPRTRRSAAKTGTTVQGNQSAKTKATTTTPSTGSGSAAETTAPQPASTGASSGSSLPSGCDTVSAVPTETTRLDSRVNVVANTEAEVVTSTPR